MALVKQAEDAASNKKEEKRDIMGLQEQVFVRKVIELHDKYLNYVVECFQNHTLFHKALKEAFEVFCNKGVAGSSSAELLATFCDNILKKGGSEKLSDEAIEETLECRITSRKFDLTMEDHLCEGSIVDMIQEVVSLIWDKLLSHSTDWATAAMAKEALEGHCI